MPSNAVGRRLLRTTKHISHPLAQFTCEPGNGGLTHFGTGQRSQRARIVSLRQSSGLASIEILSPDLVASFATIQQGLGFAAKFGEHVFRSLPEGGILYHIEVHCCRCS